MIQSEISYILCLIISFLLYEILRKPLENVIEKLFEKYMYLDLDQF